MDDDSTLAGWHRDPSGRHELRFWNGDRWSEHIIDSGIPGLDAPTRSGRAPAAAAPTPPPPPPPDARSGSPVDAEDDANVVDLHEAEAAEAAEAESGTPAVIKLDAADPDTATGIGPDTDLIGEEHERQPAMSAKGRASDARSGSNRDRQRAKPEFEDAPVVEPPVGEAVLAETEPPNVAAIEPEPVVEATAPSQRGSSARAVIVGPTVASPAGNSAGSNTSAIADPHLGPGTAAQYERSSEPRVAGVTPVPVKRYRPGSPPPSPFARPAALPVRAGPVGTIVAPWYRKPLAWVAIAVVTALVGTATIYFATRSTGDPRTARLGGRAPAGAPRGSRVIDGDGFGIAAPIGWITTTDPGQSFPQLVKANWGTPLAALDPGTRQGLIVIPLHGLAHLPLVDPDLFWTDQIESGGTGRPIQNDAPLGVHGYRANRVTITDLSGTVMVAAAIDTGDRTYLVAFTGPDSSAAKDRFERLIQTFDAR